MSKSRWGSRSILFTRTDHALPELVQLLLVLGAHLLEQAARCERLLLVDLRDGEADVDQDPVAGAGARALGVEQADVDVAADSRDVHPGQRVGRVDHFNDLARNGQAHPSPPWVRSATVSGQARPRPRAARYITVWGTAATAKRPRRIQARMALSRPSNRRSRPSPN